MASRRKEVSEELLVVGSKVNKTYEKPNNLPLVRPANDFNPSSVRAFANHEEMASA